MWSVSQMCTRGERFVWFYSNILVLVAWDCIKVTTADLMQLWFDNVTQITDWKSNTLSVLTWLSFSLKPTFSAWGTLEIDNKAWLKVVCVDLDEACKGAAPPTKATKIAQHTGAECSVDLLWAAGGRPVKLITDTKIAVSWKVNRKFPFHLFKGALSSLFKGTVAQTWFVWLKFYHL